MTFETVKEFLADVSILHEKKVYLGKDNLLKIDKATPYRSIYIKGADDGKRVVGEPNLREAEIGYIEENCQDWILGQMKEARTLAQAKADEADRLRKVIESVV